jgi:hypothetical protein
MTEGGKKSYYTRELDFGYDGFGKEEQHVYYMHRQLTESEAARLRDDGIMLYEEPEDPVWSRVDDHLFILTYPNTKTPILELQLLPEYNIVNVLVRPKYHSAELFEKLGKAWPWNKYPHVKSELEYADTRLFHFHDVHVPETILAYDGSELKILSSDTRRLYIQKALYTVLLTLHKYYPFTQEIGELVQQYINISPLEIQSCNPHYYRMGILSKTFTSNMYESWSSDIKHIIRDI